MIGDHHQARFLTRILGDASSVPHWQTNACCRILKQNMLLETLETLEEEKGQSSHPSHL